MIPCVASNNQQTGPTVWWWWWLDRYLPKPTSKKRNFYCAQFIFGEESEILFDMFAIHTRSDRPMTDITSMAALRIVENIPEQQNIDSFKNGKAC